jgi:hypothetical protein
MGTDVDSSPRVRAGVSAFLAVHGVKIVAAVPQVLGCPHEEGQDFPTGQGCPFWKGKRGPAGRFGPNAVGDRLTVTLHTLHSRRCPLGGPCARFALAFMTTELTKDDRSRRKVAEIRWSGCHRLSR